MDLLYQPGGVALKSTEVLDRTQLIPRIEHSFTQIHYFLKFNVFESAPSNLGRIRNAKSEQ